MEIEMPDDDVFESDDVISYDAIPDRDQDGIAAMHDTAEEAGDESEVDDLFDLDETEARELGSDFSGDQRQEPRLD